MIRVLSLFSGIGGIDLGLRMAGGFETVAMCEIDPFCRMVLAKHWPGVPIHEDVRMLCDEDVGPVDMICGGFPCQDVSCAGKGKGVEHGERSGLWREYARLVGQLGPRWVLVENVPALRTRGADLVLADLEAAGYECWPTVVGAWAVGAPHKRDRVWIVAHNRSARLEKRRELPVRTGAQDALPSGSGCNGRWPAGPGAAQHDWEEPRLVGFANRNHEKEIGAVPQGAGSEPERSGDVAYASSERRQQDSRGASRDEKEDGRARRDEREPDGNHIAASDDKGDVADASERGGTGRASRTGRGSTCEEQHAAGIAQADVLRPTQRPLGGAVDGVSARLVRLRRRLNRESLKAYGNAVVPQVVAVIGRAIRELDNDR